MRRCYKTAVIAAHRQLNAPAYGDVFQCAWSASKLANARQFVLSANDVRLPLFVDDRRRFSVINVRRTGWPYFSSVPMRSAILCTVRRLFGK